jgi:hypothetical protein
MVWRVHRLEVWYVAIVVQTRGRRARWAPHIVHWYDGLESKLTARAWLTLAWRAVRIRPREIDRAVSEPVEGRGGMDERTVLRQANS